VVNEIRLIVTHPLPLEFPPFGELLGCLFNTVVLVNTVVLDERKKIIIGKKKLKVEYFIDGLLF
jgi:hypothetical protein